MSTGRLIWGRALVHSRSSNDARLRDRFRVADDALGNPCAKGDNHSSQCCARRPRTYLSSMPSRHSSLRGRYSLPILPELPITETIDEMIVYHSDGLHVGIHDRRTNETESARLEVLAERIGLDRSRGNLANDLIFSYVLLDSSSRISRDFLVFKPIEIAPITFPLLQYNRPAQPVLRSFKHEKFKVLAVIVDGDTPLAIMILEHQRILSDPGASFFCHIVGHRGFLLNFLNFGRSWLVWMQS